MTEKSSNNYALDTIYDLCKDIIVNYNLDALKDLEQIFKDVSYPVLGPHVDLLLYYIYFYFLDKESRELFINIAKHVIDNIILLEKDFNINDKDLLKNLYQIINPQTEEEEEILKISLVALNAYNPCMGVSIDNFDYDKFHRIIQIIYSTNYNKISEMTYKALCIYVGTKMENSTVISELDKTILNMIVRNLTLNIFANYENAGNQEQSTIDILLNENEGVDLF